MNNEWFTNEGTSGTVTLENRDDGWYVASPGDVGETKCLPNPQLKLNENESKQSLEVEVTGFRWGTGSNINYLSIGQAGESNRDNGSGRKKSGRKTSTKTGKKSSTVSRSSYSTYSPNEDRDLRDFTGSGEYVNVEATIDAIFFVKKNVPSMPDVKGELTDSGLLNPVTFVVENGVRHPYLEEGRRFRFENVKDHFYKNNAEVQVKINNNTNFIEIE